jgi:uncharacterized membrane protein
MIILLWIASSAAFAKPLSSISFTPGTSAEQPFLSETDHSAVLNSNGIIWRFADENASFIYRFEKQGAKYAMLTLEMSGEYKVEASIDQQHWATILNSDLTGNIDHHNRGYYQASLLPFFHHNHTIFLRFSDNDNSGGWGPSLYHLTLDFIPGLHPLPIPDHVQGILRVMALGWGESLGYGLYHVDFHSHWLSSPIFIKNGAASGKSKLSYSVIHPISINLPDLLKHADVIWMDAGASADTWKPGAESIAQFVRLGGSLVVCGSWETYGGSGGGGFLNTPLASILPVKILTSPDIDGKPCKLHVVDSAPFMKGIGWSQCPQFQGHNRVSLQKGAHLLARWENGDPAMAWWKYGKGKVFCFTSTPDGGWGAKVRRNWSDHYGLFVRHLLDWITSGSPHHTRKLPVYKSKMSSALLHDWDELFHLWKTLPAAPARSDVLDAKLKLAFDLTGAKRFINRQWRYKWTRTAKNGRLWNGVRSWDYLPSYDNVPPSNAVLASFTPQIGYRLAMAASSAVRLARISHSKSATLTAQKLYRQLTGYLKPQVWPPAPMPKDWSGKPTDHFISGSSLFEQEPEWIMQCGDLNGGRSPQYLRWDQSYQAKAILQTEERAPVTTNYMNGMTVSWAKIGQPEQPIGDAGSPFHHMESFFTTASTWFDEPLPYMTYFQEFKHENLIISRHLTLVWGAPAIAAVWRFENRGKNPIPASILLTHVSAIPGRELNLIDINGTAASVQMNDLSLTQPLPSIPPGGSIWRTAIIAVGENPAALKNHTQAALAWCRSHLPDPHLKPVPWRLAKPYELPKVESFANAGLWRQQIHGFFHFLEGSLLTQKGTYREVSNQRSLWTDCDLANAARGLAVLALSTGDKAAIKRVHTVLAYLMSCQAPSGAFYSRRILDADGHARAFSLSNWCCSVAQCTYPLTLGYRLFAQSDPHFAIRCLDSAQRAGGWLIHDTDADGSLFAEDSGPRHDFGIKNDYPGDVHGLAAIDLCELYRLTHDIRYLNGAAHIGYYLTAHADELMTNGNAIGGLCALWNLTGDPRYLRKAEEVADQQIIGRALDSNFDLVVAPQLDELDYAYRAWMLCDVARAERLLASRLTKTNRAASQEMLHRAWAHLGVADWMAETFFGVNERHRSLQDTTGGSTWGNVEVTGMEISALAQIDAAYSQPFGYTPIW